MAPRATPPAVRPQPAREWHRRPFLSRALRLAVFGVPVGASFAIAALLSRVLPRADGLWSGVMWTVVIAAASLLTLVIFERGARRLLPLAALLNVSLLFPDKAPRRFAVARRTGSPSDLRARLEEARATGHTDEARSMEAVVELVLALSVHDRASRGHSERVRVFTDLLADELKLPESARARLRWAALLHDIGKLEVPASILNKPGKPSDDEWAVLHRHPEEGARLVAPLLPWLGEWGAAVVQHHERFDGTGYPHGLAGMQIAQAARIVAVADTYEVMTAPRAYKRPMSVSAARAELVRVAGSQLDPDIVRAFLNVSVGRLWRTIGFGAWIAQIPTLGRIFSFSGWAGSGIATATTATVLAVGGVVGPSASPPAVAGTAIQGPAIVGSAPSFAGSGPAVTPTPGPPPPLPSPSASGTPGPGTAAPTTPAPGVTHTPGPRSTPTPSPTPTAGPDPWVCQGCTNTSPSCVDHCSGSNLVACVSYCQGSNNSACTSHCYGNMNAACLDYCVGNRHDSCLTNCRPAPATLADRRVAVTGATAARRLVSAR
jgi:hypothetical protein